MESLAQFIACLFILVAVTVVFACCIRPNMNRYGNAIHVSSVVVYGGVIIGAIVLIVSGLVAIFS